MSLLLKKPEGNCSMPRREERPRREDLLRRVKDRNYPLTKEILERNTPDVEKLQEALFVAAKKGMDNLVLLLSNELSDSNYSLDEKEEKTGLTAIELAYNNNNDESVHVLFEKGADLGRVPWTYLRDGSRPETEWRKPHTTRRGNYRRRRKEMLKGGKETMFSKKNSVEEHTDMDKLINAYLNM